MKPTKLSPGDVILFHCMINTDETEEYYEAQGVYVDHDLCPAWTINYAHDIDIPVCSIGTVLDVQIDIANALIESCDEMIALVMLNDLTLCAVFDNSWGYSIIQ